MKTNLRLRLLLIVGAAAAAGSLALACSGSDPAAPSVLPPGVTPGTPTADGGTSAEDAAPGTPGGECFDAATQKPEGPLQFLNQCNGTGCFPFDNATRIQGFVPGAPLPPLG